MFSQFRKKFSTLTEFHFPQIEVAKNHKILTDKALVTCISYSQALMPSLSCFTSFRSCFKNVL